MIKVLFIGMTTNPGGLETYMINIFSKLQNKGFLFYFINISNKPIVYSNYIRKNNGVIYKIPFKNGIKKYLTRYNIAKQFFKLHHNFDIVHINALSVNEVYWAKAARKYGETVIFQSHNSGIVYNSKVISFFGHILGCYNKLYFQCNHNINKLAASTKCGKFMFGHNSHFKVIPNGIDTNYFRPSLFYKNNLREKYDIGKNDKVLITTARLNKQKNYPKIIKSYRYVHSLDRYTKLIIIGNGSELSYIKHLVRLYKLKSSVLFLGLQTKRNISKLLNIADLMIMPSFFEAVPFSLTEAQSEGIPAVVSLEGLPKEANITGQVTYISLEKSNLIWAEKILDILSHHKDNFRMRESMNRRVKDSSYNLNNSISQVKNYYLQISKSN